MSEWVIHVLPQPYNKSLKDTVNLDISIRMNNVKWSSDQQARKTRLSGDEVRSLTNQPEDRPRQRCDIWPILNVKLRKDNITLKKLIPALLTATQLQ